ncbi:MAG: class II aldolase/adducin family protein [Rhodospirillales bacterium]|nr:class II aldolase/adducin family protein [Rhodospirillales bacterium]
MDGISRAPASTVRTRVGAAEWEMRVKLAACYRLVERYGMSDMVYTHISARVPGGEEHFLLNPYGMLYREITASSLVKVDLEGRVVDAPDESLGLGINPAGFVIHSAVHAARPDVECVIHTHTRAGIAVSAMKCGLLPLSQHAMRFHERIGYHDYEGPALEDDEKPRLVADLGDRTSLILRNHGLLVCGPTVEQAFNTLYWLEMACKAQVDAMASGAELAMPSVETARKTARRYDPDVRVFGLREWPALLRMLDAADPSYRD